MKVLKESSRKLAECIDEYQVKVDEANEVSFAGAFILRLQTYLLTEVNSQLKRFFKLIIPSKRARLVKVNQQGSLVGRVSFRFLLHQKEGIQFQIQNRELNREWKTGIDELSGGQKTLLSICFILSIAKVKGHGLYLLDECDAALDEMYGLRLSY